MDAKNKKYVSNMTDKNNRMLRFKVYNEKDIMIMEFLVESYSPFSVTLKGVFSSIVSIAVKSINEDELMEGIDNG